MYGTWRAFLETPETFRVYFGCHHFLLILKTKNFTGIKFCNKCALSYLEIIVRNDIFGPEKFSGKFEKRAPGPVRKRLTKGIQERRNLILIILYGIKTAHVTEDYLFRWKQLT